ncbi:MAG: hypothetical protein D6820_07145 [Lentisphaerae bacterium]|nr:MAG: hypothetical protein D6820_07145 [Lentisphaerota bacterium]
MDRLVEKYEQAPTEENLVPIQELVAKANAENLGNSLAVLFVQPHLQKDDVQLTFDASLTEEQKLPDWRMQINIHQDPWMRIHVINTMLWIKHLPDNPFPGNPQLPDFFTTRWESFLKEIAKLPSTYILFMLILQEIAKALQFFHVERRGGVTESARDEDYHTLLWGFKQLEIFVFEHWHIHLRSHYAITWHEPEWLDPPE